MILKQSTAVDILIGPFVDEDDGKTLEESLTISQGDVMLSKNGQALAQKNDNTACAFDDFGCYNCELDATDTDTVGILTVVVFEDGALPFRRDYQVVEGAVYDILYADAATGAVPVASIAAGAITAAAIATDAIDADALAADALTEINAQVVDALNVDTYAEPGQGNPAATASLVTKIGFLYKAWRNKSTTTATEYALYADDGTTKDQEAVLSDDATTASKGEVSTGA